MATIIRLKKRQANKIAECAEKIHKASKKLTEYLEELLDSEEFDERNGGGGYSGGSGGGGFRDDADWDDDDMDDDDEINERRGVPGTGR